MPNASISSASSSSRFDISAFNACISNGADKQDKMFPIGIGKI